MDLATLLFQSSPALHLKNTPPILRIAMIQTQLSILALLGMRTLMATATEIAIVLPLVLAMFLPMFWSQETAAIQMLLFIQLLLNCVMDN